MVDVDWAVSQLDQVYKIEEQFRFSLATELVQMYGEDRVEVEWEVGGKRRDIVVRRNGTSIPIELKYLTNGDQVCDERFDESFELGENHDSNRYHYHLVKDIKRLERVVSEQGGYGFFVLLTNISHIWTAPSQTALHEEFRVYDGRTIQGEIAWSDIQPWMKESNMHQPIELDGKYKLEWNDFTYRDDIRVSGNPLFRYLLIRID